MSISAIHYPMEHSLLSPCLSITLSKSAEPGSLHLPSVYLNMLSHCTEMMVSELLPLTLVEWNTTGPARVQLTDKLGYSSYRPAGIHLYARQMLCHWAEPLACCFSSQRVDSWQQAPLSAEQSYRLTARQVRVVCERGRVRKRLGERE